MTSGMRFRTTLLLEGKTATGLEVPPEVVAALGSGKKPAVTVTLQGHRYRSTVAPRGDRFLIPVSADIRKITGLSAGDDVEVQLDLDTEPRVVTVPADLSDALDGEPDTRQFFEKLSYSQQLAHVLAIEQAKTTETRQRRVAKVMATLREGRRV
jgi:hypothetical protein